MPTVIDATVVNSAYDTSGNGGRKLVRLSNGWLVALVKNHSVNPSEMYLYKSIDNGQTWARLCYFKMAGNGSSLDATITNKGNTVYIVAVDQVAQHVAFYKIDATTQTDVDISSTKTIIDTSQTAFNGVSLAINEDGTELHAAWASKNSTYPNSFNIRYAKGTINADGSVTWGAVEQWTKHNTSGSDWGSPTIVVVNGDPIVIAPFAAGTTTMSLIALSPLFGAGVGSYNVGNKTIYGLVGNYPQSSPSAIFVPQSVNGLPNGLIGNAWHGTDSASGGVNYIRFSKSTDLGANWSAMQKLVPGTNPTLTANRNGKLFITYEDNGVTKRIESTDNGDTWSAPITVGNGTNPSSLFDLTIDISVPLTIRKGTSSVLFNGAWNVVIISVPPGYIGKKTSADKNNLLTYSLTSDDELSTITEKINGTVIATRTNPANGQEFTVSLTQEQWDAIKFGNGHTLTIEMGNETWTYTFDKRLHVNDDILSAFKGVQDLKVFLDGIKAKFGQVIREKGGTVNDTDSWDTIINAISNIGANFIEKFILNNVANGLYPRFALAKDTAYLRTTTYIVKAVDMVNGVLAATSTSVDTPYLLADEYDDYLHGYALESAVGNYRLRAYDKNLIKVWENPDARVQAMCCLTPTHIFSIGNDGTLLKFSRSTGEKVQEAAHGLPTNWVTLGSNEDFTRIIYTNANGQTFIFDANTLALIRSFTLTGVFNPSSNLYPYAILVYKNMLHVFAQNTNNYDVAHYVFDLDSTSFTLNDLLFSFYERGKAIVNSLLPGVAYPLKNGIYLDLNNGGQYIFIDSNNPKIIHSKSGLLNRTRITNTRYFTANTTNNGMFIGGEVKQ
jgi:hypothetical protein